MSNLNDLSEFFIQADTARSVCVWNTAIILIILNFLNALKDSWSEIKIIKRWFLSKHIHTHTFVYSSTLDIFWFKGSIPCMPGNEQKSQQQQRYLQRKSPDTTLENGLQQTKYKKIKQFTCTHWSASERFEVKRFKKF